MVATSETPNNKTTNSDTKSVDQNRGWKHRSAHWLDAIESTRQGRKRRERQSQPLILTGQGLSLKVDKGCLLIRGGLTHHPQARAQWRFFKGELDIPHALLHWMDGAISLWMYSTGWPNRV